MKHIAFLLIILTSSLLPTALADPLGSPAYSAVCAFNPLESFNAPIHTEIGTVSKRNTTRIARNADMYYCQLKNYPAKKANSANHFKVTAFLAYSVSPTWPEGARLVPFHDFQFSADTNQAQINFAYLDLERAKIARDMKFLTSQNVWIEAELIEVLFYVERFDY